MEKMPSLETLYALRNSCGEFQHEPSSSVPAELAVGSSPLKAVALPLRSFFGGELREGAFAFVWKSSGSLNFLTLMEDSDPYSDAASKDDRTWEKGDVMELFLQPPGSPVYFELHVAPTEATLELRIKSIEEFRGTVGMNKLGERLFNCEGHMEAKLLDFGWAGFIAVPLNGALLNGSVEGVKFSVCRYNYNRPWGPKPELSSISDISKEIRSFHCPEHWLALR